MTKLSVNINKVATLRNARGGNVPNVAKIAVDCQKFGAEGITVHPRPDERHIRYADVFELRPLVHTEFNIEGYPSESFIRLILAAKPEQVTLVPDPPEAITSSAGWNAVKHFDFLKDVVAEFKKAGIRTSVFMETDAKQIEKVALTGTNRIEFYTEPFTTLFPKNAQAAVLPFVEAAKIALNAGLELNAGHDLDLHNLRFLIQSIPQIKEVSIGHALICDALYLGLENTIQLYLREIQRATNQ